VATFVYFVSLVVGFVLGRKLALNRDRSHPLDPAIEIAQGRRTLQAMAQWPLVCVKTYLCKSRLKITTKNTKECTKGHEQFLRGDLRVLCVLGGSFLGGGGNSR
jgi:hypothetical protein